MQFGTGISSVTTVTVSIGSNVISVTGTFADSDIIDIDCDAKDVLLNSVWEQEYTGTFWTLDIGSNAVEVAIDGVWTADVYFSRLPTYG